MNFKQIFDFANWAPKHKFHFAIKSSKEIFITMSDGGGNTLFLKGCIPYREECPIDKLKIDLEKLKTSDYISFTWDSSRNKTIIHGEVRGNAIIDLRFVGKPHLQLSPLRMKMMEKNAVLFKEINKNN